MKRDYQRLFAALIVSTICFGTNNLAYAAGPTEPLGPQGKVGANSEVGQGLDASKVGPQSPVGAQGTVGATTSTTQSNSVTGAQSENTNAASTTQTVASTTSNTAVSTTKVAESLNSGSNQAVGNTQTGSLSTGDVNTAVTVINKQNSVFAAGSSVGNQSIDAGTSDIINLAPSSQRSSLTGANSENTNQTANNSITRINNSDDATAHNQLQLQLATGNNTLSQNTTAGSLKTGTINAAVSALNLQNVYAPDTIVSVDVATILTQNPNAVIVVPSSQNNGTTGANSTNSNAASTNTTSAISVTKLADSNNQIRVNGQTGGNNISGNSSVGDLQTGTVTEDGKVITVANPSEPMLYVVNVFGDWNGSLLGIPSSQVVINHMGNDVTGVNSSNANTVASTNDTSITSTSQARNTNDILVNAVTGDNKLLYNTSAGGLRTGDVRVLANVINLMNAHIGRLSAFRIGIINLFVTQPTGSSSSGHIPQSEVAITEKTSPLIDLSLVPVASTMNSMGVGGGTSSVQPLTFVPQRATLTTTSYPVGTTVPNVTSNTPESQHILASIDTATQPTLHNSDIAHAAGGEASTSGKAPFSPQWLLIILGGGIWLGVEMIGYVLQSRRK